MSSHPDSDSLPTVMHLIDTGGPGGAETIFSQLAHRLSALGIHSLAVVPREGWLSGRLRALQIEPIVLAAKGSLKLGYLWALIRITRQERVKLIHAHLLGSAVYGALVGLLTRTRVIAVLHGPTDLRALGRLAIVKRWLLKRGCSAVVAVSTSTRDAVLTLGLAPQSVLLIPNGVDTEYYSPGRATELRAELGLAPDELLIGAVGNIRAPKAYEVLLRAAALVRQRFPRCRFVIIGEGKDADLRRLEELCVALGISAGCHFLGFRQSCPALYRNFDVFVSSSRSEGLALAFLEAMATGLPIVATRSGGPQEVIEAEKSGLLAPIEDPATLAACLVKALEDPELRRRLGAAARSRVVESYSQHAVLEAYAALYARLLGTASVATTPSDGAIER